MFSIKNILDSFIHKVCVGDSLILENEFFPYPPFEKYKYQIFAKEGNVTVTKSVLPQERVSIGADGNYCILNQIVKFKFNHPGIVFIDIVATSSPSLIATSTTTPPKPISIVVEVSPHEDEDDGF
jgi:hypothetical protein